MLMDKGILKTSKLYCLNTIAAIKHVKKCYIPVYRVCVIYISLCRPGVKIIFSYLSVLMSVTDR